MKNTEQTKHAQRGRFFAHEMAQPFVDWVKKLTFMKPDLPKEPDRDHPEDKSVEHSSVHDPADGASAGRTPGIRP